MFSRQCLAAIALLTGCQTGTPPPHQQVNSWSISDLRAHAPSGIVGVDVNSRNEVHLFHRAGRVWGPNTPRTPIEDPTILVIDGETGTVLREWGEQHFIMPHGITIDEHDNVWVTDVELHQVFKFNREGDLLLTLGEAGIAGQDGHHFDGPTDVAVLPDGSFYVSDGYGNSRIAQFSPEGRFESEWGSRGSGAAHLNLPHAVTVDGNGDVYVADRENSRIQVFGRKGKFLRQWSSLPIEKPFGIAIFRDCLFVTGDAPRTASNSPPVRIARFSLEGRLLGETTASAADGPGGDDITVAMDGSVCAAGAWEHGVEKFSLHSAGGGSGLSCRLR